MATLASLALQGVVDPVAVQQVAVAALSGVTLVLALRAAQVQRSLLRIAGALTAIVITLTVVRVTAGGIGDGAARLMNAALLSLGPPAVALGVIRELRSTRRVRIEAVMGVLSLYVLIGMLFSFVYGAIDRLGDDPFFANGHTATVSHCLYFSFTTLTTVGYGDFVAAGNLGHTLAIFEALIGQIYLVTVVSVIVSNLGRPARPGSDDAVT